MIVHCLQNDNVSWDITFCFSFELLLNQIQVNIKEESLQNNNQRVRAKICTITSQFWKLHYRIFCHTSSQIKRLVERYKKIHLVFDSLLFTNSLYSFFNSNLMLF